MGYGLLLYLHHSYYQQRNRLQNVYILLFLKAITKTFLKHVNIDRKHGSAHASENVSPIEIKTALK